MIYSWVSCKNVLATFDRNYKPGISGWITDAIEWIGEVIEMVGVPVGMEEVVVCRTVEDYKAKMPCNIAQLNVITYNGCQLPRTGQTDFAAIEKYGAVLTEGDYYKISGPYIKTSFEAGDIYIFYKTLICDSDGFPLVPDEVELRLAIADYILFRLRGRGFKHPIFANMNWADHERMVMYKIKSARNEANMPDPDEMKLIKSVWLHHNKSGNISKNFHSLTDGVFIKDADRPGTKYDVNED